MKLPEPKLTFVADVAVELGPVTGLGMGRGGDRRIVPILGGTVSGQDLAGRILPVGADWQTVYRDGLTWIDTRYAMETVDGAVIEIVNQGYRFGPEDIIAEIASGGVVDPHDYTMRTVARLETGHPDYAWVNRSFFIGAGGRLARAVHLALYRLD